MRLGKSFSVAFSPHGEWLAALTERSVRILSSTDGSKRFEVKVRDPSDVRFSPGGDAFLVKSTSGQISWHAIDGSHSRVIPGHAGEGPSPEFASNTRVVNAGWNGLVEIIDLPSHGSVDARLFSGEGIAAIHRFDGEKGWLLRHSPKATAENLPPDACYFTRWSGELPVGVPSEVRHGLRFIRASSLHPAGEMLAVVNGAPPNQVAVIDARTSTIHETRAVEPSGTGSQLAWAPDGQRLAVVENHAVRIYDQQLVLLEEFPVPYASSVAFAPNGRALAIGSWEDGAVIKQTTDAEIAAYTIGELKPHDAPIRLTDYDSEWPSLFRREAQRIREALADSVVQLEHVGSTSVPGLAAKPQLDIVLVVEDSSDEPTYLPALEQRGYFVRIREPDWYQHRVLKGPDTNINLHVFSSGCVEIDRMLTFRDWLRTHVDDRLLYEQTKRELASRTWRNVQNYADAKTTVVQEILGRAYATCVRA